MIAWAARQERVGVAVVGIGCRFPGGITDADGFWRFLADGGDAIGEVPPSRIDLGHYFDPRPATPGRMMSRWGGYLQGIDCFDAEFFGISPREAERLDPQQRLLLELAWEAFEDAGQDLGRLNDRLCGVFVGQWLSDFEARLFADPEAVDFLMTTGSGRYASSGRISYALGLGGPSMTIDSACSSSLVAVHLAARSIRSGETPMALAGGVNIILQPHISVAYSQSRMMAPDGRCKFGDASGDGYVRSEGAGLVLLKNLDLALEDGDRIYAVIRGSAANNDGRSSGSLGTPSRAGQEALLRTAYRDAGVSPGSVGYVEAHGTGTRAGDPVELGALSCVLSEDRPAGRRGYVGSVKTNLGHTEGAAGVAGLMKAVLALHHGLIPPSLHCREPNPSVPWEDMPLEIPRSLSAWPDYGGRRFAGVSAFGIAGTNAHAVLESAPPQSAVSVVAPARKLALLPLSAKSPQALCALALRYAELLEAQPALSLHDVCWTAATRRTALAHRAAFVAADPASMADRLRRYAGGDAADCEGVVYADTTPRIAFVFPGQGAQWIGMARQLAADETVFRAELQRCDTAAREHVEWSILEQLHAEPADPAFRLDRIDVIQPVLVAVAIAYTALWRSLGVEPDAVVGHSMGEVGAAYVAGILDLGLAMKVICRRSALMRRKSGMGAMAMVELSMAQAESRLAGLGSRIVVAVSNGPRSSVISGETEAVAQVVAELEREQVFCRLVKVDVASHGPQMDSVARDLVSELDGVSAADMKVPLFSTVLGREAAAEELDARYWGENLRRPVLFFDAVTALVAGGTSVFLEMGPHPILLPSIEQTAQALGRPVRTIACGRREEDEGQVMLAALGSLWAAGHPVAWHKVMPGGAGTVGLPLYPWQRERHWVAAAELDSSGTGIRTAMAKPDAASLEWLHRLEWRRCDAASVSSMTERAGHTWLVLADSLEAASAVAAGLISAGASAQVALLHTLEAALQQWRAAGSEPPISGIVLLAGDSPDAYLPVRAVQALSDCPSGSQPRLWFVTAGGQSVAATHVGEGAPQALRVSVEQGALWGAARVVAEEQPELWGGLVDLDPCASLEKSALLLARHLLAADGEDQVALRKDQRLVLRLARHEAAIAPLKLRADSSYLVTGGLGDIGLGVAQKMVQAGARRLVLLGRTGLPPREQWCRVAPDSPQGARIAAVLSLEGSGACVHTASVDVADESQLRAFLDRYEAEAWPRIRGVVHAAGSLDNHLAGSMSRSDFDAVLRPKLRGAQLLDKLLPDLDLFVLFSSTGAFLAQPGQANYAAANAGLDALARDRHARGLPAVSIGWGVWKDTGLVKGEAGRMSVAEMARQGLEAFAPDRGHALFGSLCGADRMVVSVLPMDWTRFAASRSGRPQPLYRDLVASHVPGDSPGVDLRLRLASAEPAQRLQILQQVVLDAVARVLKVSASKIDKRKALGDMGLGSLMAMELRNRLESSLGRPLSATLAWNYPTVDALCAHLAQAGPGQSASSDELPLQDSPLAKPLEIPRELSEVADMSDEDAVLALRGAKRGSSR